MQRKKKAEVDNGHGRGALEFDDKKPKEHGAEHVKERN